MSLRYDGHREVLTPPPTILDWTRSNEFDLKVNGRLMSSSYRELRQRYELCGLNPHSLCGGHVLDVCVCVEAVEATLRTCAEFLVSIDSPGQKSAF